MAAASPQGRSEPGGVGYGAGEAVLVLADGGEDAARARRAIEAAGLRVSGMAPVAGGERRIDLHAAAGPVCVELGGDAGDALEAVLQRLEQGDGTDRYGSVLVFPHALVDRIAARGLPGGIHYLCEPALAERIIALRLAATPRPPMLNDVNKGEATARLQQLSEEVGRIASVLAALSEDETIVAAAAAAIGPEESEQAPLDASQIRATIRARRLRDHFFKKDLFADPAWDMLLDLAAARLEGTMVSVSSLCIAGNVPTTTALRWIKTLVDRGLVLRTPDPDDARRSFI
ncbi:MAG: MarR family transcriptional regulator, partial [Allosphingosinicella sp.]